MAGNDSYTVALLHLNGADGSTTFTDDAVGGASTWGAVGTAQIDTAEKKFGTGSLLLDGNSDSIDTDSDSADFDFGTGDWTIDCWVKRSGDVEDYGGVISGASGGSGWVMSYGATGISSKNMIIFACDVGGWGVKITGTKTTSTSAFTHVAVVRYGNGVKLYVNGVQDGSTYDCTGATFNNSGNGGCCVGRLYFTTTTSLLFSGWIDEVRISKGVARWTADFSASLPTEEYSAPTSTIKSINGLAIASVKSINGLAIASVKSFNGVANS